ncbi:4Fe-4S dicluster domain-containing protein [Reinekea marinisedimentorum]|uniref:Fe-S-cluster-containing dehydrogenase component n=1 Tax=Reinekea marinisedimentorum TaxID=230495 RepID=A0A4R3IB23_9GAMM|nr:4Fe-4S dicluster domain-containing protein [Reinekea marinisedimentorum]TCS42709.1 Fe-S-cluster-containing dehydrogenase component [Reinekea marinisedimentorum]
MTTQDTKAKWNLVIDVDKCENCNNCFLADKDEYCGNTFPGYTEEQPRHGHRWIDIKRRERGSGSLIDVAYLPTMCNQCGDATCVKAAKNGEIYQREDGIVIIDPVKAKGKKELVKACPYGHIWWNEEKEVPQKWFFDAHLLDAGWKEPRCVQSCGTGAMQSLKVSDSEMASKAEREGLEGLKPEIKNKPRVWYKNLHLFMKEHVAGSVVADANGVTDCVDGAEVTLKQGGDVVASLKTDWFGDFKFDKLEPNSGTYSISIAAEGKSYSADFELKESVNLGVLKLS